MEPVLVELLAPEFPELALKTVDKLFAEEKDTGTAVSSSSVG